MNTETLLSFLKANWRDKEKLASLIGQAYNGSTNWNNPNQATFYWNVAPKERAVITLENGVINRVQTWSGLNWSARWGWGDAFRDTSMETYRNG